MGAHSGWFDVGEGYRCRLVIHDMNDSQHCLVLFGILRSKLREPKFDVRCDYLFSNVPITYTHCIGFESVPHHHTYRDSMWMRLAFV